MLGGANGRNDLGKKQGIEHLSVNHMLTYFVTDHIVFEMKHCECCLIPHLDKPSKVISNHVFHWTRICWEWQAHAHCSSCMLFNKWILRLLTERKCLRKHLIVHFSTAEYIGWKAKLFLQVSIYKFKNKLIRKKWKFILGCLEKSSRQVIVVHFFLLLLRFAGSSHSLMAFGGQSSLLWLILISCFIPLFRGFVEMTCRCVCALG